jgi:ribosomal protein S18 acetylase RimI-like enzyme
VEVESLAGTLEYRFIDSGDPLIRHTKSVRYHALYEPYGVPRQGAWDDLPLEARHLVALGGERVVGYACLIPEGEWAHIRQVVVESGYRRQGIATALIRKLLDLAAEEGLPRAYLNARLEAISLYDRLGFARVGTVFRTPLTTVAHLRMEREI